MHCTHDYTYKIMFCYRVITRVVLLPFLDASHTNTLTPSERDMADFDLNSAMKKASKGAGLMISLGKVKQCLQSVKFIFMQTQKLVSHETKEAVRCLMDTLASLVGSTSIQGRPL